MTLKYAFLISILFVTGYVYGQIDIPYDELFTIKGKVLTELDDLKEKVYDYKHTKAVSGQVSTAAMFINKVDVSIDGKSANTYMKLSYYELLPSGKADEQDGAYLSLLEFNKLVSLLNQLVAGCDYDKIGFKSIDKNKVTIWGSCKRFHVRFFPRFKQLSHRDKTALTKIADVLSTYVE